MKVMKPFDLGPFRFAHRVVMPPLTRMRAGRTDGVPSPLAPTYYGQRATVGGLIIWTIFRIFTTYLVLLQSYTG